MVSSLFDPHMASASTFILHTFSSLISTKLTEDNYLTWMQHVGSIIKAFHLTKYITREDSIPKKFVDESSQERGEIDAEFENFEQENNLLKSWLLESMGMQFKIRMIGCQWSYQIWHILKTYFASQTRARVKQVKIKLRNIKKTGPIGDYLVRIKHMVGTLAVIGSPLT